MNFIPSTASGFIPASHEDLPKSGSAQARDRCEARFSGRTGADAQLGSVAGRGFFQPHYHEDMQEVFVLLSGIVTMKCGEQTT